MSNERNSAIRSEHREVKCQWLNEKSELESRHFQTMALNTQIQGTLRKKERDYDKLQVSDLAVTFAVADAVIAPIPVPVVVSSGWDTVCANTYSRPHPLS